MSRKYKYGKQVGGGGSADLTPVNARIDSVTSQLTDIGVNAKELIPDLVSDGVTSQTTKIQSAVNTLAARGGKKTLIIPADTAYGSVNMVVPNNVKILDMGVTSAKIITKPKSVPTARDPVHALALDIYTSVPLDWDEYNVQHGMKIKYMADALADSYHHLMSVEGELFTPYSAATHDHNEIGAYFSFVTSKGGADNYGGAFHVRQADVDAKLFGHSIYLEYSHQGRSKIGAEISAKDLTQTNLRATVGVMVDGSSQGHGGFQTGLMIRNTTGKSDYFYNEAVSIANYSQAGIRIHGNTNALIVDNTDDITSAAYVIQVRQSNQTTVNFGVRKNGTAYARGGVVVEAGAKVGLEATGAVGMSYNTTSGRLEMALTGGLAMTMQGNAVTLQGNKTLVLPNTATGAEAQGALRNNNGVLQFYTGTKWQNITMTDVV